MYKKSLKAVFKLQRALSSSNPSISTFLHLYDHTIKPILMYGSEITGMSKTSSAACRKENEYLLQQIDINDFIDKSHFKYLKYILGVNKKSTNLAILSELGRYPLYFSVVLSMLKYWFRDRPFNLKRGGGVMVFCFVQNFFFGKTQELEYFFFFQNITLSYMTKTLNQIIFFLSSTKIRTFFSATLGIRIFF